MAMTDTSDDRALMERITAGLPTKSARIRALAAANYSRSEIAKFLEIRYQHVWNVLNSPAPTSQDASLSAPDDTSVTIGPGGRIVIPAAFRKAMGVEESDDVVLHLVDKELHVMSRAAAIKQVQELIAQYAPEGVSLVDELLAERRREAAREDRGE